MATNFIYTNPAAGQQAVQYAQLQAQDDADKRRLLGATLHDMSVQGIEAGRNNAQMGYSRAQLLNRSAEAERDRALQREGYRSAENINTARSAAIDAERTRRATEQTAFEKDQLLRQQQAFFQAGETDAAMMNDPKVDKAVKVKIAQGRNVKPGASGLWVNAHPNPALLTPAIPTIADLKARQTNAMGANRSLLGTPAVPQVPFSPNTIVTPMPSPGNNPADAPFSFRVPVDYPGGPLIEDAPPMEIVPQDEILRYSPPLQVPFDEYLPSYDAPRRKVPFAILPY